MDIPFLFRLLAEGRFADALSKKTIADFLRHESIFLKNKKECFTHKIISRINSTCSIHDDLVVKGSLITGDNVRIGGNVRLEGNIILSSNVVINDDCFIRGDVLLGSDVKLGRSVEIKDCLVGTSSSVGPLSFLGDSILGSDAYLGALVRTSNERLDRGPIQLRFGDNQIDVGKKFGCIIGDGVQIGLQSSIMPGRVIPMKSIIPPLTVFKSLRNLSTNG